MKKKEKILITGGAGYIGSTLIRDMLAEGYQIYCLDILVYGDKALREFMNHPNFKFIQGDIRNKNILRKYLKGINSVIHLAAIVGDLPCRAAPKAAIDINYQGTKLIANYAKKAGVERFIYTSTCSNYGISDPNKLADENSKLNPVSLYAKTKINSEKYLTNISDKDFCVTCLRFATAFGTSLRTRFDLLINSFAFEAWSKNKIVAFAANTWRPYIHVADMSRIIMSVLKAPKSKIEGEIFNAGSTNQNYTKKEVVEILNKIRPQLKTEYINTINDRRDYRVNFRKLEKTIGFKSTKNVEEGFKELLGGFESGVLTKNDYETNKLEALEKFFGKKEKELNKKI